MPAQLLVASGRQDVVEGWRHLLNTSCTKHYTIQVRSLWTPTDVTVRRVHAPQEPMIVIMFPQGKREPAAPKKVYQVYSILQMKVRS